MKKISNILLIITAFIMCMSLFACNKTNDLDKKESAEAHEKTQEENKDEVAEPIDTEKDEVSDLYKLVQNDLSKEIKDDNKAFIISLGAAYDEETLKEVLSELQFFKEKYSYDKDFEELLMLVNGEDGKTYLMGQEFYLLIPKYDEAEISMKELELKENGELEVISNSAIDEKTVQGATLVCQNISDIAPNGEIHIKDKSGEIKFSPYVSLKDGELMLDEGAIDASEVLTHEGTNDYDEALFEKIFKYMPKF